MPRRAVPARWPRRCARTRAGSGRAPSPTRSAGPSTPSGCSTSAPRPSSSCCWATSAGPAAASWPCAATPPSRAPPTSPPSTTCCPATSPCRRRGTTDLAEYLETARQTAGFWGRSDTYIVSLLKAWFGEAATADNDFCFDYLPRIYRRPLDLPDRHGHARRQGARGSSSRGEPGRRLGQRRLHRKAMAKLDWLVVRDLVEIETAQLLVRRARDRDRRAAHRGHRHRGVPAPGGRPHREGRHLHQHPAAAPVARARRSSRSATAAPSCGSTTTWAGDPGEAGRLDRPEGPAGARPDLGLPDRRPARGAGRRRGAARDQRLGPGRPRPVRLTELKADGSTACGCWIYCGSTPTRSTRPPAASRGTEQSWVAPEWGWAWPANRRILYNRASADPDGRPWSERKRYVWWDEERGRWTGDDVPDFRPRPSRPATSRPTGAEAEDATAATSRSSCRPTARAGCSCPTASTTGRCPPTTSRRSRRSPTRSTASSRTRPARSYGRPGNRYHPPPATCRRVYPYVFTTYRLTEHHTAGGMSRVLGRTCPSSSRRCSARSARSWPPSGGLVNGGWATIVTARAAIEARVLVTERLRPLRVEGQVVHQVGLPYHWGSRGLATGDAANDLLPIVLRPQRPHPGVQGQHLRHPARPPPARPGPAPSWSPTTGPGPAWRPMPMKLTCPTPTSAAATTTGPAADGVLHRHHGLHRLQGLRGGLQGVEPGPRGRAAAASPATPTTTPGRWGPAPGATSPSSSNSATTRGCAG